MPCVLIVEDDADCREMLELLVTSYGYETMAARNGYEALTLMRQRRPCMVLLDMMMPVMDGWEFCRQRSQDAALAKVPVVAVTAYSEPDEVEAQLGIPCIPKRAEFGAILTEIREACGESRD
jgi:CheY-like chemotaxis protein